MGTVLADLALILLVAFGFAALARRLGQPPVIGEIVGGLALGPSLLGLLPGHPVTRLFPIASQNYLQVLAQLGVVLFMFGVGYHFEPERLRGTGGRLAAVSAGSLVLPFILGAAIVPTLLPLLDPTHGGGRRTWGLAVFLGSAMAITAFPVLARILSESRLRDTALGQFALACAAVQDASAWCLLAAAVVISTSAGLWSLGRTVVGFALFLALMVFPVRLGLRWVFAAERRWSVGVGLVHPIVACGLLLSAWATQELGLHAVFGAFLFGAVVPRNEIAHTDVRQRIEQASLVLLPVFFTVTGLTVDLATSGLAGLALTAVAIVAACVGKFTGAWGSARLAGMHPRDSVVLGVLLNTRGLTELIVLDVGLSLHVLDPLLFSAMVVMAVVTTVMTSPLLRLHERRGRGSRSGAGLRYRLLDEPQELETAGIGALNEDV